MFKTINTAEIARLIVLKLRFHVKKNGMNIQTSEEKQDSVTLPKTWKIL